MLRPPRHGGLRVLWWVLLMRITVRCCGLTTARIIWDLWHGWRRHLGCGGGRFIIQRNAGAHDRDRHSWGYHHGYHGYGRHLHPKFDLGCGGSGCGKQGATS